MPVIPDKLADLSDVTGTRGSGKAIVDDGTNFAYTPVYSQAQADTLLAAKASTGSNTFTGSQTVPSGSSFIAMNGGDWSGVAITGTGATGKNASDATTWSLNSATGEFTGASTTLTPSSDGQSVLRFNQSGGTRSISLGTYPSAPSYAGIWFGSATPSSSNYNFLGNGAEALFNANASNLDFRVSNGTKLRISSGGRTLVGTTVDDGTNVLQVSGGISSFGSNPIRFNANSSTATNREQSNFTPSFVVSTDASRTSRCVWNVFDTAAREAMRVEATGSAAKVGIGGAVSAGSQLLNINGDVISTATIAPGSYTVATLPTAGTARRMAWASNGRKNGEGAGAGTGVPVFDDGTAWRACDTGATVAD